MAAKGNAKVAADFEKIINEGRDRKKNEALAAKIFSKDRRSSTPVSNSKSAASPFGTLASRAGVKKQRAVSSGRPRHSTGNIDGEWTHDLHDAQPPKGPRASRNGAGSLAARITDPKAPPTGPASHRQQRRAAQVAQALIRSELQTRAAPGAAHAARMEQQRQKAQSALGNGTTAAKPTFNRGMTIRGLAGPFVVMAQNFAPGTTAADIESAMTPVGGIITSCRLVKQHPIVIAEIIFESKEGADNVIATFNNQTADGRVLSVYAKPGNTPSAPVVARPTSGDDMVVDGSWGFDDPMETTDHSQSASATTAGGLYSDNIVKSNRSGRGFNRNGRFGAGAR
ncbi:RRM domain-containing protein [Madurella fahalii]|uniref:RRM domain-containing protein n=1 Tax=Madurella fahalii TaxID=1157608 RepID=A0ABQ0GSV7_9PEZI